jgi:hypothetical protein
VVVWQGEKQLEPAAVDLSWEIHHGTAPASDNRGAWLLGQQLWTDQRQKSANDSGASRQVPGLERKSASGRPAHRRIEPGRRRLKQASARGSGREPNNVQDKEAFIKPRTVRRMSKDLISEDDPRGIRVRCLLRSKAIVLGLH